MRRSAKQFLQSVGRTKKPDVEVAAPPETREPVTSLPVERYDKLPVAAVLAHLGELAPKDLAQLSHHERSHQNRLTVLAEIDAQLGHEPWPGYDELDVDGVRFGLDGANRDRFAMVLAYERAHKNRAGVVLAAQQKAA
jgi:hypothetical protein